MTNFSVLPVLVLALTEVKTYCVNEAKWKAAIEYCKDRRMQFKILTEHELKVGVFSLT